MQDDDVLLYENNIISLRTAAVLDDGDLVFFMLDPAWLHSSMPRKISSAPKDFEWASQEITVLYRHLRSQAGEEDLICGFFPVERSVKPMAFDKAPPEFKLLWADSGNSVALYLNGEPWAFIDEETHCGYSKGLIRATIGSPWNQKLFERIFEVR